MPDPIRVVQYGLGPIGQSTVQTVLDKAASEQIQLVGAIDIDPEKVGRDVADPDRRHCPRRCRRRPR